MGYPVANQAEQDGATLAHGSWIGTLNADF
jgi:hypothetical protein